MKGYSTNRKAALYVASYLVVIVLVPLLSSWLMLNPGYSISIYVGSWALPILLLPLTTVGALISARQPGNPVGWIMMTIGFGWAVPAILSTHSDNPDTITGAPLASWVIWLGNWSYVPALVLLFTALPLLFPTGKLPSRRWKPVLWLAALAIILWSFETAYVGDEPDSDIQPPDAINSETLARIASSIDVLVLMAVAGAAIAAILSIVVRFRHAQGIERLQMKWFAFVIAILTVAILLSGAGDFGDTDLLNTISSAGWLVTFAATIFGLPIAIGFAILRYRLYEIDRIINRSLVYGSLTVLLLLSFVGSVVLFQFLLDPVTAGNDLAVAGSTLLVAALFRPVRNGLQHFVDRRFYRQKYDARQVLQDFSVTAREAVQLDQLTSSLTDVVATTVQPAHVSIWLPADRPGES